MDARRAVPFLVLGLMLVPVAFLTWLLLVEKDRGIESARREKQGLEYVLPVSKAARLAALHRGLSFGYLNGNQALRPRLEDADRRVDKAMAEVDAADAKYGGALGSRARWRSARTAWQDLKASGPQRAPGDDFAAHTAVIEKLLGLIHEVSESSGLLFEPRPDAHFLIDAALVRLPRVLEDLGELRGRGSPMLAKEEIHEDDRLFVFTRLALIREEMRGLGLSVASASKHNPGVDQALDEVEQGFRAAVERFASSTEAGILKGQRGRTPDQLFALGTAAIDAGTTYVDLAEVRLDALLEERLATLQANRASVLGTSALVVGLIVVIAAFVVRSAIAQEAMRQAQQELQRSNQQLEQEVVERKRAEALLAEQSQELARSNAELEQFAYVASHDLQEPLRMVGSYMQLLEQRYQGRLDADADGFIGFAVDGAKRMQVLINDLLSYSRVGTKGRPFQPTDCEAAFGTAVQNLRVGLQESGAQLTHGPLPTVLGDATQLTQLFQNLIANAIKFRGPGPPEVHVQAEREDSCWRFSVRDNGIGIAPEYLERVFVLFQRLHGRGAYAGTGIGLAICKKVVEGHRGRIWVESVPGSGATFCFTIPRDKERPP